MQFDQEDLRFLPLNFVLVLLHLVQLLLVPRRVFHQVRRRQLFDLQVIVLFTNSKVLMLTICESTFNSLSILFAFELDIRTPSKV